MNFVVVNKKRINPSAKKNENVSKFWTTRILKELVITVGNEPILINTFFHYEIIWKKKRGAPRSTILKNRINHLITPVQAIGHETPDLETSSRIIRKSGNKKKWWVFEGNWYLVIWYASRLATASSLPNPFDDQKYKSQNRDTLKSPWLMPWGHVDRKLPIFRKPFEP